MTVNIQNAIGPSPGEATATRRTTRKSREGTQTRGGSHSRRLNLFSLFPFHFSRFLIETRKRLKIAVNPTKHSAEIVSNRVNFAGHLVQVKFSFQPGIFAFRWADNRGEACCFTPLRRSTIIRDSSQ
jgi:hypothetical protein